MQTHSVDPFELLKKALETKFGFKKVFIFGSSAYGNPDKNSDIDLCIITDLNNKRKIDVIREVRRELIKLIHRPFDILVYSENEFNERSVLKSTLEYKILTDGKKIYG